MDDELEEIRPPTGELPPEVWADQLLQRLDSQVAEVVDEDGADDEAAWAEAMAAANARAAEAAPAAGAAPGGVVAGEIETGRVAELEAAPAGGDELVEDAHADGIADETGPHETATDEVPEEALESLDELESLVAASGAVPDAAAITSPGGTDDDAFVDAIAASAAQAEAAYVAAHAEAAHAHVEATHADAAQAQAAQAHAESAQREADAHARVAHVELAHAELAHAEAARADAAQPDDAGADAPAVDLAPLVELLRGGRCILCAGPRLGYTALTMRDLLARLIATLSSDEVREVWPLLQARPLSAAGYVMRRLGDRFAPSLRAALGHTNEVPDVVTRLGALPFRGAVTARTDDWLERALVRDDVAPPVFTPRDAAALRAHGKTPFVLKLLGDPARPETLVWSHETLQAALADADYRAALAELWRTRTFVFVGFDAGDVELSLITERLLAGASAGDVEHWAFVSGVGAVERDELWAAWHLRVVDLGPERFVAAVEAALAAAPEALPEDDDAAGWLQLYAADPLRKDAIARLDRLAVELREKGDLDGLLELALARVDVEPDAHKRGQVLLQLARMFEFEADDAARALTALLAAYREDPSAAEWRELSRLADATGGWDDVQSELDTATLPVAVRLELARRFERWPELVRALDEAAAADPERGFSLRTEAAELVAGRLDDRAGAIARYEALATERPGDLAVLKALDLLYEAEGRQVEYLENLERQADATSDLHERAAFYRRLALLWEDERGGAVRAEQCWQTLLTIEPEAEDALRALERCYRAGRRFEALIEALKRRARLASPMLQAEIFAEVGSLYAQELGDTEQAIQSYLLAEQAEPGHEPTLTALARLFDETGAWHSAVDRLVKRATLPTTTPADALPLYLRAGELAVARLDDPGQAERHYARALEIDPTHVGARTALAALHRRQGAPLRAARLLVEAAEHTQNHLERTRFLVEAALLYEEVDDDTRATELYLLALELDPEHVVAGARVADLLWRQGRWGDLVPVLEMLTRKDAEADVQLERLVRLARAAKSAEQPDKAARAWARAADVAPSSLEAQRGHADVLLAAGDWAGALQALERIFQYHIDALEAPDRAHLFGDLARCEVELGARESAREFVARALEADPAYRPALLLQADLSTEDPQTLIEAKRALSVTAPPAEQVRLLDEIGDLYYKQLGDAPRAVGAWAEALELAPDDHRLLHKSLDAFVEDRAWSQALEMLERLIAAEKVDAVRAKYHHTAGLICRDELKQIGEAAAHLKAALDDDPEHDRSARALEEVYKTLGDDPELARLYRRRLKTLGPESPGDGDGKNRERLRVWSELGALCLRSGERQAATAAFEAALVFDRDSLDRHKQLADLYLEAGPDAVDKAIDEHHYVLRREKSRIASYRALRALYAHQREREKAFACSYALHFLKKGDADDARAVAEVKARPLATARRVLDEDAWSRLVHPDEDRLVDCLLALVGPTIAAGHAQTHKLLGLSRKDAVAADDRRSFAKALGYVTHTLDVAVPEAYERPEQREPVLFANAVDGRDLVPVFQLGAPLVGDRRREPEQVFELGRKAALLRPERLLRLATPHPQQIGHVLEAAIALAYDAEGAPPAPQPELQRTVAGLKRALPPLQLEQVVAVGKKLRETAVRTDEAAVQWLQATDLTAIRVGYALVGDLEICARLVAADGRPAGARAPTERLLDLIWSSVTEEMFAVRRHLGLA